MVDVGSVVAIARQVLDDLQVASTWRVIDPRREQVALAPEAHETVMVTIQRRADGTRGYATYTDSETLTDALLQFAEQIQDVCLENGQGAAFPPCVEGHSHPKVASLSRGQLVWTCPWVAN